MRYEVRLFAKLMERELAANDHKPGWKFDSPEALMMRLIEEAGELAEAIRNGGNVPKEAIDVANFAMMIYDVWMPSDKDFRARFEAARRESGDNMPMADESLVRPR